MRRGVSGIGDSHHSDLTTCAHWRHTISVIDPTRPRVGDALKGATCTWVLVAPFSRMCSVLRPGIEKDYYGPDSASVSIASTLCLVPGDKAMSIRLTACAWSSLCRAIISIPSIVPGVYGEVTDALQLKFREDWQQRRGVHLRRKFNGRANERSTPANI